ncbi:IS1/IS1595 family N-terminal zinc-binding domain-containing protein [Neolewinella lacunae]
MLTCTSCKIIMYGKIHHQKQYFRCKDCNRKFVVDESHWINKEKRGYIE